MSITLYQASEIVEGEVLQEQDKISFAIKGLMSELDPLSQKKYGQTIQEFLKFATDNPGPMSVVFSSYLGQLRDRGLASSTINGKRIAVRRFAEWAARVGYIDYIELLKLKDVKSIHTSGSKRGKWLTQEQLKCVLEGPDTSTLTGRRDKVVLAVLIGCAMRREEITQLKWNQLIQQGDVWIFENVKRKHGRTQEAIVVPGYVKQILDEYMPVHRGEDHILVSYNKFGTPRTSMTAQSVYNIVKQYTSRCGFEGISPHDLRRSSARNYRDSGLELEQIQLLLGHSNVAITQGYVNTIMDLEKIAHAAEL
jgi:site-specific recombinase XerD